MFPSCFPYVSLTFPLGFPYAGIVGGQPEGEVFKAYLSYWRTSVPRQKPAAPSTNFYNTSCRKRNRPFLEKKQPVYNKLRVLSKIPMSACERSLEKAVRKQVYSLPKNDSMQTLRSHSLTQNVVSKQKPSLRQSHRCIHRCSRSSSSSSSGSSSSTTTTTTSVLGLVLVVMVLLILVIILVLVLVLVLIIIDSTATSIRTN